MTIQFNNLNEYFRWLRKKTTFTYEVKQKIGKALIDQIKMNIDIGNDVFGQKFVPLKRISKDPNKKILIDTKLMYKSYGYRVSGNSVLLGNNVPYAPKHQLGLEGFPIRATLPNKYLPKNMQDIIKSIMYNYWRS